MLGTLSLDQLRVLVTIDETGSFSAAGRRLNRAQSAISQAVATLEATQGVVVFDRSGHRPVLTEMGRVLVAQARRVLSGAAQFEALAAAIREGVEPELAVAIDPLVPTGAFIESLHALEEQFPHLPVSFSTEGLGGAERRLRQGDASLALCVLLFGVPEDLIAVSVCDVVLVPVVSADHELARLNRAVTRADLAEHVQLVLSDPSAPGGPHYGVLSPRRWRFVELGRRFDFLLGGLGWCRMPGYLVEAPLRDGRLVRLEIVDDDPDAPAPRRIYAATMRDRALGRAGSWLLDDLRTRFSTRAEKRGEALSDGT
ncbi:MULTISPECIES: LysR family transcriptional regulator [Asaia]|uniref:LysR family transcriptional regulator n=1 Tax=Asaia TaxID=91914 RepID=UPI002FC2D49E